ncbi:hypothetical protein BH10ACT8_BH10ACT8_29730 [soil metagenome]
MTDLQTDVATAADQAGAHSTAPALLLQLQAALGNLARDADESTEGGRRPFRIAGPWSGHLAEVAYLVYLLADQTGVSVDDSVRGVIGAVTQNAARQPNPPGINTSWF